MTVVLWQIELSHYSEKVRWALEWKQVSHVRRAPMLGVNGPLALILTGGRQRRLPVLTLDGRRIGDSTAIVAALEERWPEPPLYPEDPAERARALELEDYFDEWLAPEMRRFVWFHVLPDTDNTLDALFTRGDPGRRRALRAVGPVTRAMVRTDYGVDERNAALALERVRAAMDRIEDELQPSGYLVGDCFGVADLSAAALFTPLLLPPEREYPPPYLPEPVLAVREELAARPGGQWVHEMFARHRHLKAV